KKLTPRQRELFELSKEQDLSNAEIEERLGISNQAVRNRIAAAVKIIREEMKDYLPLLLLYFQL
ncbi:MAG: HTH domain-containing protein, partial [Prevotella sp.]|nr:HTH domain-containing protein [Prevotella sp.]